MTTQTATPTQLNGPSEAYDLHTTAESFAKLEPWVEQYGDVFAIKQKSRQAPAMFINRADILKHILIANHQNYTKGVVFDRVKMLLGNGIIVSEGTFWRRQRRMVQPAFSKEMIVTIGELIKQCNLRLLEDWKQKADSGEIINITDVSNQLALEIILRAIFSDDFDGILEREGGNPFSILTDDSARDIQLVIKFRELKQIIQDVIDQRRVSNEPRQDFLSVFLSGRDKDTGEGMTDREVMDEVTTLIVAGSETSAATMNWVWYFMSQHPDVEKRVHEEIDAADYESTPNYEQTVGLEYLRKVIEESLRVYPPVWLYSRKAVEDDQVGDLSIPAGTDIFISPYFMHRNTDYWTEPEIFNPARFDEDAVKSRHKQSYLPFSAGPRRCIGDFFGIFEVQVHFAILARHFRLCFAPEQTVELAPEVNLRTLKPLLMTIESRNQ